MLLVFWGGRKTLTSHFRDQRHEVIPAGLPAAFVPHLKTSHSSMWESKTTGFHSAENIGLCSHVDRWRGTLLYLQRKTWYKNVLLLSTLERAAACQSCCSEYVMDENSFGHFFSLATATQDKCKQEKEQSLMRSTNCCPVALLVRSDKVKQISLTVLEKMCLDLN